MIYTEKDTFQYLKFLLPTNTKKKSLLILGQEGVTPGRNKNREQQSEFSG